MQQQIGIARLGQGRAKRRHQIMRQIAHETHGIGHHHIATGHALQAAHGGIKGGKQLVGLERRGASQGIEQGGFAGIGIAHQRHPCHATTQARAPHLIALHAHLGQTGLEGIHAPGQEATVGFQLGFTGATQTNGTTGLAFQMGPAAHQARGHVLQLSQFNLQLALVRLRPLGKDIEDQAGAIHHPALQDALQVALLHRRQGMVDQHQVNAFSLHHLQGLIHLATTDQGGRIDRIDACFQSPEHLGSGRARQFDELFQQGRIIMAGAMRLDQQGPLALAGTLEHHSLELSPSSPGAAMRTLRAGTTVEMACL